MSGSVDGAEIIDEHLEFFSNDSTLSSLKRAAEIIGAIITKISTDRGITEYYRALLFVQAALNEMIKMPAVFDLACQFNIRHMGSKFVESLQVISANESEIETIFSICYRFVVEFELKSNRSMSSELGSALNIVEGLNFVEFKTISTQLKYAKNHMAIHIMRDYINHPHMASLKELPIAIQASETARLKSNEELSQREERVNALENKLKGYENAYNFVGLYQGFSNLRADKDNEKNLTFKFLIVLGVCLILVPLLKVLNVIEHNSDLVKESFSIATLLALELMVVYFFRITLQNFRSTKAQLLQIDLRMTLCQFINSYVEFATDARKSDKELLTKFEQVIFSGIVTEDSGIPSTFDGLEHVVKIVESLKPR